MNDFSLIESELLKKQYLIMGPISFVNHSCKPNAKYQRFGSVMRCVTLLEVSEGEEVLMLYDRNYFGTFNEECCCPYKLLHKNPCPPSPEKRRKRKRKTVTEPSTSKTLKPNLSFRNKLTNLELSTRFNKSDGSVLTVLVQKVRLKILLIMIFYMMISVQIQSLFPSMKTEEVA